MTTGPDSVMSRPNDELLAKVAPDVPRKRAVTPHANSILVAWFAAVLAFAALLAGTASAQQPAAAPAADPPQVRQLLELLNDPAVRGWLEQHRTGATAAATPASAPAEEESTSAYIARRAELVRGHLLQLAAAVPRFPGELATGAQRLWGELSERGVLTVLLLIAAFVGLGLGCEWLLWRITAPARARLAALTIATVGERLLVIVSRFVIGVGLVLVFAAGSVGAFLAFDWPPLLHDIVLGYLVAVLILRLSTVVGQFFLAQGEGRLGADQQFRMLPIDEAAADFWFARLVAFVGWFAFGWMTVMLLGRVGVSLEVRQLLAYVLGLVLMAIGIEAVWRRPLATGRSRHVWFWTVLLVALWLLWVAGAMQAFWTVVVVAVLPLAMRIAHRAITHVLRPPGTAAAEATPPSVHAVYVERGMRALLILLAVLILARAWGLDFVALTASDAPSTRLARGALHAIVILLAADFAWHLVRAIIDRKLAEARGHDEPDSEDARRQARLRTLLPILRNIIMIVLLVMAALMALSALGLEIGPLIAGAGVVGVALGFGAQTLVRDVISGMFYLLDDAFRVGEYIQSGNYKGTVEAFSLRSIKLRHHRGPLFTVPFGVLGAVQNMSRDWVIDKFSIGVTYDADLEKARKLIKQIGKDLAEDPDLGKHIMEPLKMQGVDQFGDFAIQIRIKMMTKPGEQFVIRRKAYGLIKKAFDANGIKFAYPTVQVAGGTEGLGAAAQMALDRADQPKPAG
jgi:small-conductance mechanosensitive channel